MDIELTKEARAQAVRSIERYFNDELEQRIGNLQAGALLNFFLEEIGPCIYNRAIGDAQDRLQVRVSELDIECQADEFAYWRRIDRRR